ncbi:MAG: hypothetical protein LBG66_01820, partial [Gallionellaceae bacterium]|nr:hypothetical protein [Gallionellaceae bacterium]
MSPDGKSAGSLSFVWQDNAEYCAGIVETPKATWLIGYVRDSTPGEYTQSLPRQPFVIDSLLTGYDRKNDITRFADSLSGNSRPVTFVSKLSAEGKFELVATVGGIACLQSSPDGASVFLLTDMNLPEGDKGKNASIDLDQTAVFRSDDQGQNWHWLRDGLFPQAEYSAWAMKLGFYGPQGMWVFGGQTMSQSIDIDHPKKNIEGVIYHSSDLGRTVKTITVPPDMVVPTNDSDDIKRFVFQTSDDRAYAWTSQWKTENGVCTSAVLELRLHDGRWQAGEM